ncbi:MAG: chromophore lyase CpcT/CpeT [Sinobacteraceae bacterium]|nr:chromophore lyase CpcT/CpeT [Nevskiaceae bacterium]
MINAIFLRDSSIGVALARCLFVVLACSIAAVSKNTEAAPIPDDPSARDLQRLVLWFEGDFDNQEQIWFENDRRSATPASERHERVHATHRRVNLPAFGQYVFYVEEYLDDDPAKVFRQRLVTFESAREAGVRMKLWFFKDPASVRGAHRDPSIVASITPADVTGLPGCDVLWVPQGDQYVGGMEPRACVFGEKGQRRYSQHDLVLSPTKYWRVDRIFLLESDKLHEGHSRGVPHKMMRTKMFSCDISFYADDYLAGPHPDDEVFSGKEIHSQGGTIAVTRKSDGMEYVFRLRDKEYPYYEKNPDFMFLSVRRGTESFLAYSLHDPAATLIGFNLGWLSVFCERVDPLRN